MKIAVLVKQVPDTWSERRLDTDTGLVDRLASPRVLDEICEYAVETALRIRDEAGGEVLVISMGPETAGEAIKRALEMGADEGFLITDSELTGADLQMTAAVLAAAIQRVNADMIVAGNWSTDGRSGLVPPMLAEHLGMPLLNAVDGVQLSGSQITAKRSVDGWAQEMASELPVVVSVTEQVDPPRVPGLKGVLRARKRPIHRLSLKDLGIDSPKSSTRILSAVARPSRIAGPVLPFSADTVRALVDLLFELRLIERRLP